MKQAATAPRRLRPWRLAGFGLLAFGLTLAVVWFGAAGRFVRAFVHPGCSPAPAPLAGWAYEEVTLATADGLRLTGWYYPSQNGAAVIALGGLGGALGETLPLARPLLEAGFGVLQVGSRACAVPAAPVTLGLDETLDAAAALAYLRARPEVDPARIGVMGFSMGGVTAIRFAARTPEVQAVWAEGGYYNLGDDFVEPDVDEPLPRKAFLYTLAAMFWLQTGQNPWDSSPITDLPAISPRPVLLVYGDAEAASGRAEAQFAAARPPKDLWLVPGGGHGTNHLAAPAEYTARLTDFFQSALFP